jgi:PAS domain S-box-containing protein
MRKKQLTIDEVRKQTIDNSLIVGSVLGTASYVVSLLRLFKTGFHFSFLIEFFVVTGIIVVTIFRSRLSTSFKTYVFISLLAFIALTDVINYGLFSAARVYLILIPFYAIFHLSLKRTLIIFSVLMLCFFVIGYLYHINILNLPHTHNPLRHVTIIYSWLNHGLAIAVVAVMILLVTSGFINSFSRLIFDLKESHKIVSESERNYREIFNSSTDAIFIHDLKGRILDVNNAMLQMYGCRKEEIKYSVIEDFSANIFPYTKESIEKYFIEAKKGKNQIFDWHAKRKNGEVFWVEVALKKASIGGKDRVLAFVRDINEKKSMAIELENYKNSLEELVKNRTAELETANRQLMDANKALAKQRTELEQALSNLKETQKQLVHSEKMASLGLLSAGIAHEINNPLNFIYGGVIGLENYVAENMHNHTDDLKPFIEGIRIGVKRAADIVTSLNNYSRRDEVLGIRNEIHSIIDNCLTMLKNQLKHKIEVEKKYTNDTFTLFCNESKLHQAILNILTNAVQAIPDKGKITITTKVENNKLVLLIADTGIGISKENLPKITDPFFTTKEPGKGTGLGLSITLSIIEEHKGTMDFISEVDKGTTVIITFPINKTET